MPVLKKEANPSTTSGRYPVFLVISEMNRRNTMNKMFAGDAARQNQPQETVADRVVREANPDPTQIASLQGLKSPRTTYQEEPRGQETMGMPGVVRLYEGGRVSFQNTPGPFTVGQVANISNDPRQRLDELNQELAKAQANPRLYGLGNLKNLREQIAAAEQQIMMQDPEAVRGMGLRTIEEIQADIDKARTNPRLYGIGTIQNLEKELEQRKPVEDKFGVDLSDPQFQQPAGLGSVGFDLDPTGSEGLAVGMKKDVVGGKTVSDVSTDTGTGTGTDTDTDTKKKVTEEEKPVVIDTLGGKTEEQVKTVSQMYHEEFPAMKKLFDKFKISEDKKNEILAEIGFNKNLTPEEFKEERARLRATDSTKEYNKKLAGMKDDIEKEKAMAKDTFILSIGLNMIATAGESGTGLSALLKDTAKALNMSLPQFTSAMKEVKQSEKLYDKADLERIRAEIAREEGDIKEFDRRKQEEEKLRRDAGLKKADVLLKVEEFNKGQDANAVNATYKSVLAQATILNTQQLKKMEIRSAEERTEATLNVRERIANKQMFNATEIAKLKVDGAKEAAAIREGITSGNYTRALTDRKLMKLESEIRALEEGILIYPEGSKNRTEYENLINKRKQEYNDLKKDRDDFFGGGGIDITTSPSTKTPYKYTLPTPD